MFVEKRLFRRRRLMLSGCGVLLALLAQSQCSNFILPPIDLGPAVYNCTAQPITLNAGAGYDFYIWSNGATTQSITVSQPGTYYVTTKVAGMMT